MSRAEVVEAYVMFLGYAMVNVFIICLAVGLMSVDFLSDVNPIRKDCQTRSKVDVHPRPST